MRLARIAVLDSRGIVQWCGSLHRFCRANMLDGAFVAEVRASISQPHGRPEPVILGGGAAPLFYVSLLSTH